MKKLIVLIIGIGLGGLAVYFGSNYFLQQPKTIPASSIERTLALIKPDAVKANNSGKIIDRIEQEGFTLVDIKKIHLGQEEAEKFYAAHKDRPFFKGLVEFMQSGPIIAMILEKENAIESWRKLMGATDPQKADSDTIRAQFGTDVGTNATHGSDSPEAAKSEIKFFFADRLCH